MMKRILFLSLFIFTFALCKAQNDSINLAVKLNFVSPIDVFNFPTIDLSLEKRITNRISISAEGGYELYHFYSPDTTFIHPGGYKAKMELRFYHPFASMNVRKNMHGSLAGFYIGFDFFYRQEQYNSSVYYTVGSDTANKFQDDFWTKKSAIGGNLIFGYQEVLWKRLVVDEYLGIGILNRTINNHELEFSEEKGCHFTTGNDVSSLLSHNDLKQKNGIGANATVGIRIGYVIY
jgi:hypothetical protein